MIDLRDRRALVMGLGVHGGGLGVVRFLVAAGARVTVTDLAGPVALQSSLAALDGVDVQFVLGEHREEDFYTHDLVIPNPGVPRESPYLAAARAAGAQIETEMTLFFRCCPTPTNILGITGTKGKTTTTMLVGSMLRRQFPDTVVAGNLRVSALEQLPHIGPATPVVLELSSWQLEGLGQAGFSPHFACVTNMSPDHLNRYADMANYAEAKKQILLHQPADGVAVLSWNDPIVSRFAEQALGKVVWVAAAGAEPDTTADAVVSYGEAVIWHAPGGAGVEALCERSDIQMPGFHNLANVAVAAALARCYGLNATTIRDAVRTFPGVPHRLELIRELNGVRYINDTAATAPAAAIAALTSVKRPIVLLAGGADKQLPFDTLARAILTYTDHLVLLQGSATPKLQAALETASHELGRTVSTSGPYDDFGRAIIEARQRATAGGTVLLAPGCASFGMFRNEFHRGDEFRRLVQDLR